MTDVCTQVMASNENYDSSDVNMESLCRSLDLIHSLIIGITKQCFYCITMKSEVKKKIKITVCLIICVVSVCCVVSCLV